MVSLIEGSTDIGGTRTSIAMQLAETLGIAAEDVIPTVVDTDSVGYTDVTGGSRVTLATGLAAHEAGLKIRQQMCEAAAAMWEIEPSQVTYKEGCISNGNGTTLGFKELARELQHESSPLTASAERDCPGVEQRIRMPLRRCRSRSRHGEGDNPALHRRARRGHRDSSRLRRRTDAGRSRPRHRLGAQRRVLLRRQRT